MRWSLIVAGVAVHAACADVPPAAIVVLPAAPPSAAAVVASSSVAAAQPSRATAPIVWETSERDARERARRTGRPLVVWLRADWSAGSLEMERTTWLDGVVADAARPFVAVRLDLTDAEGDAQRYAEVYDATVPTIVLFNGRGERRAKLRGVLPAPLVAKALRAAADE